MLKPFLQTILGLLALMAGVAFLSTPARAQQAAMPEYVARGFYSWYLHQLSRDVANPLKQKHPFVATVLCFAFPVAFLVGGVVQ